MLMTAACSGDPAPPGPSRATSEPGLHATVVQQRIDEGTRRIAVEVTTDGSTSLHVVGVQLVSPGFEPTAPTPKDTVFAPRQTIDLTLTYGDPVCDGVDPTAGLAAELTVQEASGTPRTTRVPVTGPGVGLVRRLHESECAQQRLYAAVSLQFSPDFHRRVVAGRPVLAGRLQLRRPDSGGSGAVVVVDSLSGSVLFDFLPRHPPGSGPVAQLSAGDSGLSVPVVIASRGRCDQHARSQSTQTFLFSVFVRVAGEPEQRQIMVPPRPLQRQALAYLDAIC